MFTWQAGLLIGAVVVLGLLVLGWAGLRLSGAVKRLNATVGRTGARFADETGLLKARRAALRVAIAQRKATVRSVVVAQREPADTDAARARVPSLKGRQESDLIG